MKAAVQLDRPRVTHRTWCGGIVQSTSSALSLQMIITMLNEGAVLHSTESHSFSVPFGFKCTAEYKYGLYIRRCGLTTFDDYSFSTHETGPNPFQGESLH